MTSSSGRKNSWGLSIDKLLRDQFLFGWHRVGTFRFSMMEGGPMVNEDKKWEKIFLDWDCLIHVDPNEALFELEG